MSRRTHRSSSPLTQPPSASTPEDQAAAVPVSSTRRPRRDPLVGRFFHSFEPEAKYPDAPTPIVRWQGRVLGRVDSDTYLVELFSWDDGLPNGQQLQSLT